MPPEPEGEHVEPSIFDAPRQGLGGRFAGSVVLNLSAQGLKLCVQVITLAVMSRLLSPAAFGVMAMATPIVLFGNLLQDLGMSQATVQQQHLTQRQASNMFWVSVAVGSSVGLLLAALSPLVSMFYRDGRVGQILLASAPVALISSAGLQHRALLMRRMMFRQLVLRDMASIVAGMIAAISCAVIWRTYWAIYASSVAQAVVATGGAMIATRWVPSRPSREAHFRKMVSFGAGLSGYTLSNFVARNMDKVLIGRFWGGAKLGLYDRGYRILLFPLQQINWPVVQVMNPALSKLAGDPVRYREAFTKVMQVLLLITLPGILILALAADWLVPIVLGGQWLGVIPIFRNLSIAAALQAFNMPLNALFITQNRTGQFARWGMISVVICTTSFAIGLPWGPTGVALSYALTELTVLSPLYWWFATRDGAVRRGDLARIGLPFVLACLVVGPLLFGARMLWSPHNGFLGLAVYLPLCYALFWSFIALFPSGRSTFRAVWKLAYEIIGKRLPLQRLPLARKLQPSPTRRG